jgi:hypothetical protein
MSSKPANTDGMGEQAPEAAAGTTAAFLTELRGGGGGGDGGIAAAKGKLGGPTLLVAGIMATGLVLLLGMRHFGKKEVLTAAPVKLDYTPDEALGKRERIGQKNLEIIRRTSAPPQVPGDEIKKNPFELASKPVSNEPGQPQVNLNAEAAKRDAEERARRVAQVQGTLASLKLQSVMDGPTPIARVSGEIVRVGDTLSEIFTVTAITGRSVTLQVDGKDFLLEMAEMKPQQGGAKKR